MGKWDNYTKRERVAAFGRQALYPLEPPTWKEIKVTHILTDRSRIEITSQTEHEIKGYVKLPSDRMTMVKCDGCAGPHSPKSKRCTANTDSRSWIPDTPGCIYSIRHRTRVPGVWTTVRCVIPGKWRTGHITLRRIR